jgi:hypothetical protein
MYSNNAWLYEEKLNRVKRLYLIIDDLINKFVQHLEKYLVT